MERHLQRLQRLQLWKWNIQNFVVQNVALLRLDHLCESITASESNAVSARSICVCVVRSETQHGGVVQIDCSRQLLCNLIVRHHFVQIKRYLVCFGRTELSENHHLMIMFVAVKDCCGWKLRLRSLCVALLKHKNVSVAKLQVRSLYVSTDCRIGHGCLVIFWYINFPISAHE